MEHISEVLNELVADLRKSRDNEISMAAEVAGQYVTDHNDKAEYRRIDREVTRLARAWDQMIAHLERSASRASVIEAKCENFYGD